jgi:hypothetical protein
MLEFQQPSLARTQDSSARLFPLQACSAPMTGTVGVCCRDPDYKDPWPNMGGNGGGHEHQHQQGAFDDGQYHGPAAQPAAPAGGGFQQASASPSNQQAQPYSNNFQGKISY